MNLEFTVSLGFVAVPRSLNGVLLEFGRYDRFEFLNNTTARNGRKRKSFVDLNHILFQFRE